LVATTFTFRGRTCRGKRLVKRFAIQISKIMVTIGHVVDGEVIPDDTPGLCTAAMAGRRHRMYLGELHLQVYGAGRI
jgi:hypothetical protein